MIGSVGDMGNEFSKYPEKIHTFLILIGGNIMNYARLSCCICQLNRAL